MEPRILGVFTTKLVLNDSIYVWQIDGLPATNILFQDEMCKGKNETGLEWQVSMTLKSENYPAGRPLGWEIALAVDRPEVLRGVLIRLKSFVEPMFNPI